jgi:hypothetical protein
MTEFAFFRKRRWPLWTADVAALLGLAIYFVQSIVFAHTTVSNLDEGAYLLKGFLFATGQYHPFDPGISTNKAPFSFLIPGYVQLVFGPGLRTGRYLAVFFGVLAVIGTWVAARRIGGKWLAAGSVWVLALSPTIIKYYSGGATQSTIACLLVWSLVLVLGENRPTWQLMLSGFLAGLMIMVRQNMLPVLPTLALYALWQHGWKKSLGLLLPGLLFLVGIHVAYWPRILQLWTWVPLIRIPEGIVYSGPGTGPWSPDVSLDTRLLSVFQTVRFHFIPLLGSLVSAFLWSKLSAWKSRTDFRMGVFLLVLFWGLLCMHAMASISRNYCVFCFSAYISFFNIAGILFLVVALKNWNWHPSLALQIPLIFVLLLLFSGMGFSFFETIGDALVNLPAPRVRDFQILPGWTTWESLISNKFHIGHGALIRYASAFFGFLLGVLVLSVGYLAWRKFWRVSTVKFAAFFSAFTLALGFLLSPVLHGTTKMDCNSDVIAANEKIGKYLRSIVPPGKSVYWDGGLSAAPLLYLPQAKIFPPQINDGYSFIHGGDTAKVFDFGFWNEEMAAEWKSTADFFIIEGWRYSGWKQFFSPDQFDELSSSPVGTSCLEGSTLRIFRRK